MRCGLDIRNNDFTINVENPIKLSKKTLNTEILWKKACICNFKNLDNYCHEECNPKNLKCRCFLYHIFHFFFMPGFIFLTDQSTMSLLNLWESKQSSCFRAVV